MDPYMEGPTLWSGFHHTYLTALQERLGPAVRPKYFVRVEERVYVSREDDPAHRLIVPDMRVVESARRGRAVPQTGAAAIAAPIPVADTLEREVHEYRLEVLDQIDRSVVAVIELLSPTNKVPNSVGRASFLQKRHEVFASEAHWIEIDLLRDGVRTANLAESSDAKYQVYLSRADTPRRGYVWPIYLREALPTIGVPLRPGDDDVPLNLQDAFAQVYEVGGYDLDVAYAADPIPPLTGEHSHWAAALLANRARAT
jgi:hypothetical protein